MKKPLNSIIFFIIFIIVLDINCTSSPRYSAKNTTLKTRKFSKKPSRKKNKNNSKTIFIDPSTVDTNVKHKKIMNGLSSFYSEDFHGKLTANGEIFDMYGLTAAHKTLPLNTVCRVTNLSNNKSLILRINDRGPYVVGRILDCSYGAAKKLGFVNEGTTEVKIEVIEWGDGVYMHHRDSK
tara:strand:- start:630 stop:1169 length:540 start_codon:yes stop_codon:yes gene_type:complete